jgi:hypothetical protein
LANAMPTQLAEGQWQAAVPDYNQHTKISFIANYRQESGGDVWRDFRSASAPLASPTVI